jgi:hypothetical protein
MRRSEASSKSKSPCSCTRHSKSPIGATRPQKSKSKDHQELSLRWKSKDN